MKINPNILQLDIKVQDKFRELLANLDDGLTELSCVVLGDSDIDYENSQDMANSRIVNAPFNVGKVKYPLIYNGGGKGLEGFIQCFVRKVNANGTVSSMYNFPANQDFSVGNIPPELTMGYDVTDLVFPNEKSAYIIFAQTILANYVDSTTGLMQRLNEEIDFNVWFDVNSLTPTEVVPADWEVIKDKNSHDVTFNGAKYTVWNNSIMIAKKDKGVTLTNNGRVDVLGTMSNITKTINFNI